MSIIKQQWIGLIALFVALAGSGAAAANLVLGSTNTATKTTVLKSTGAGPVLSLQAKTGQPPLAVNSSRIVTGLNSEFLNGKRSTDFAAAGSVYTKSQSDGRYSPAASSYTKTEADARYFTRTQSDARYARSSDVYTRDSADATFAPLSRSYTKAESTSLFAAATNVYTKSESDARYAPAGSTATTVLAADTTWNGGVEAGGSYTQVLARTVVAPAAGTIYVFASGICSASSTDSISLQLKIQASASYSKYVGPYGTGGSATTLACGVNNELVVAAGQSVTVSLLWRQAGDSMMSSLLGPGILVVFEPA